ncbi:MAG: flavodoxin family protein [Treponema sp.]|jgi:multimeric flavodoxin WrbA|nr:flavodoxin family protein [Treponema sp.]
MKFLLITGNPKQKGLCFNLTAEILRGAREGGAETETLRVDALERCHVCAEGWGACREQHRCSFGDDGFNEAQEAIGKADAFCFVSPVYWGEMAEALKCFFDRLRRCEAAKQFAGRAADSVFAGKQVLLAASPGGVRQRSPLLP